MKGVLVALLLAVPAGASPYVRSPLWRVDDVAGPIVTYEGIYIDPRQPGKTSVGHELALLTHDPKDGCALPSVVCEQWAPVATGLSINGGRVFWDIGPTVNVFPWMVAAAGKILNISSVAPADASLSFALGPKLGLNPIFEGKLQPLNQWGPRFLIMTAAQVRW